MRYQYVPDRVFTGDAVFFNAALTPAATTGAEAWSRHLLGRIDEYDIDCEHADMTTDTPIRTIAKTIAEHLHHPARH